MISSAKAFNIGIVPLFKFGWWRGAAGGPLGVGGHKTGATSRPGERRDDSGLEDNAITGLIRFCSVGGLDGQTTGISVSGLVLMDVMLPPFCERDLECPSLYDAALGLFDGR